MVFFLGHQNIVIASPIFAMKPNISNGYLRNEKLINNISCCHFLSHKFSCHAQNDYMIDFFVVESTIMHSLFVHWQVEMSPEEANRIFDLIDTNKSG